MSLEFGFRLDSDSAAICLRWIHKIIVTGHNPHLPLTVDGSFSGKKAGLSAGSPHKAGPRGPPHTASSQIGAHHDAVSLIGSLGTCDLTAGSQIGNGGGPPSDHGTLTSTVRTLVDKA